MSELKDPLGFERNFSVCGTRRQDGSGNVKELKDQAGEKRLRVGDDRVRFTEEHHGTLRIHTVWNRKDAYR